MGMDSYIVKLRKEVATCYHISYDVLPADDRWYEHELGYWRKCYGLDRVFMSVLAGNNYENAYSFLHRINKKQCKYLIKCMKDIDSPIYTDTIWETDTKSRKKYRKEYLKTMKKVLKKIKDGKQIYYGCSY